MTFVDTGGLSAEREQTGRDKTRANQNTGGQFPVPCPDLSDLC
ncbi:hypothetical protein [Bacteroides finegoldii]|nr:hypothetical protein [Bacteroides finegoldii]